MAVKESTPGRASIPVQRQAAAARPRTSGSWAWILQRLTAFLLIVFLGTHLIITHFVTVGQAITFDNVSIRLESALLTFVDGGMLAIGIYHALNGLRNIIVDFNIGKTWEQVLAIVLIIFGLVAFVYGINALLPFTTGTALFYR